MYGVALDNAGNSLLMGGSGDEYPYEASGSGQWAGWSHGRPTRSLLRPPSDSIQPAAALRIVHNAFNARPLASRSLRESPNSPKKAIADKKIA